MDIRQKFQTGVGALLLIIILAGGTGIWLVGRNNLAVEALFQDNYDSVVDMHQLTESMEQINTHLEAETVRSSSVNRSLATKEESLFEAMLLAESQHVTETGEQDLVNALELAWQRYKHDYPKLFQMHGNVSLKTQYYQKVLDPEYQQIKDLAWRITDINLKSFSRFRGRGKQLATTADRWMTVLLLVGMSLSAGLMLMLGKALLRPIQELMQSAREIEKGNLDLVVRVESKDELGQLGEAFNSMAGRLREFRRSDRARLIRIQKTTQMAINSFNDAVAVINPSLQVEISNHAAEELFGLKKGGQLRDSSLAHLENLFPAVLRTGEAHEPRGYAEVIQVFQQGMEKFVLPRILPVLDDQRRVVGVTLVLVDVTGLRKMDEMKTDLLSTVSHELKTPLTSIRMATHLLLEDSLGPFNAQQSDMLATVRDGSDRLHAILEDLLDLGRLQAGKSLLQLRSQSAKQLIEEAVDGIRTEMKEKGLQLELSIEGSLPAVAIDPQRISHVFTNLFSNAIKYSPKGGSIQIGAETLGSRVRFWVRDSGPGIPPTYRNRVFERFFRVPHQDSIKGAGLGLAIAKEIVEMHAGEMFLNSRLGQGSTFSFELPIS